MVTDTFKTCNFKLEQFLFAHDIRFKSWRKNDDGLTEWVYDKTPELTRVVEEFRAIFMRRVA